MRWMVGGAVVAAATLLLLTTCSPSPESLAEDGRDLPGVIQVAVRENGGSDGIPLATIPMNVAVLMEADASAADVEAVFDEYDDEIDDGDVDRITVTLDGPAQATLAAGEEIHPSDQMVALLVEAGQDERVTAYRHEAFPVGPSISVAIDGLSFAEVAAVSERYRSLVFVDGADASSGPFYVGRNVDDDRPRVAARLQLAAAVDRRFGLTGAPVADGIPLELYVSPAELTAASAYVADHVDHALMGRVTVGSKRSA